MPKTINEDQEDIICEAIYNEWTEDQLDTLALEKDLPRNFPRKYLASQGITEKEAYVKELSAYTRRTGMKQLIRGMDKEMLEMLTAPLDEAYLTSDGYNTLTIPVLAKRLFEKMAEYPFGLVMYIGEMKFEAVVYNEMLRVLGEEPVSTKRKYLYGQLNECLEVFYLKTVLETIPANFLKMVCDGIRIKVGKCTSSQIIADCMIYGKHYVPGPYYFGFLGPIPTVTKKPKKIKDGLTKSDLEYWFTRQELKDYCVDIGVAHSGKKQELSAKIVAFWKELKENHEEEGDMEEVHVQEPEKKKEKKTKKSGKGRTRKASRPVVTEPLGERDIEQEVNTKAPKSKSEKSAKSDIRLHELEMEPEPMDMDESTSESSF